MIDKLIDIVSKNGNLLLNVPPKADGTFDDATVALLKRVGQWMAINGEAIYATRPWKVYGEGPDVKVDDRDLESPYGPANFRFTTSKDGRTLYVIQMGSPEAAGDITLTSFAKGGPGADLKIAAVALVGGKDAAAQTLKWSRDDAGLKVTPPTSPPDELAVVYKVTLNP